MGNPEHFRAIAEPVCTDSHCSVLKQSSFKAGGLNVQWSAHPSHRWGPCRISRGPRARDCAAPGHRHLESRNVGEPGPAMGGEGGARGRGTGDWAGEVAAERAEVGSGPGGWDESG